MSSSADIIPTLRPVLQMRMNVSNDAVMAGQSRGGATQHIITILLVSLRESEGGRADGLEVELVAGGSDWVMADEKTNTYHINVRTQGKNQDGDGFSLRYVGYLRNDDMVAKFLTAAPDRETTKGGDHYWYINPIFETSSKSLSVSIPFNTQDTIINRHD